MKSLMRRIDIFCFKHPNFGVSNLMLYIIIGNVAFYILSLMDRSGTLLRVLAFDAQAVFTKGEVWRLFTFVLIPESLGIDNILWFVLEMYFYYFIGRLVEGAWGKGKFTIFYISGTVLTILYGIIIWPILGMGVPLTQLYFNLSLFFVFATLFPDAILRVFFIIPLKAKWIAWAELVLYVYFVLSAPYYLKLLPVIVLFNYILFCGDWLLDRISPKRLKAHRKQRDNVIKFKTAAREYNRKQAKAPYTRKCEVCGRTDRDYPNLEFRFCSRCSGYHCFCIDHINSHVHFKEE